MFLLCTKVCAESQEVLEMPQWVGFSLLLWKRQRPDCRQLRPNLSQFSAAVLLTLCQPQRPDADSMIGMFHEKINGSLIYVSGWMSTITAETLKGTWMKRGQRDTALFSEPSQEKATVTQNGFPRHCIREEINKHKEPL